MPVQAEGAETFDLLSRSFQSLPHIWKMACKVRRQNEAGTADGVYFMLQSGEPSPGNRCVVCRCYPYRNSDDSKKTLTGWRWVYRGEYRPITLDVVGVEKTRSGQTVLVVKALDARTGSKRK